MATASKPNSANQSNAGTLNTEGGTAGTGDFKYTVNKHSYPLKTSTAPDMRHYMGFFINIRGKSKYKDNYKTVEVTRGDEQSLNKEKLGSNIATKAAAAGAAYYGAKAGASAIAKTTGLFGNLLSNKAKKIGTIAGGITGLAAGAVAANYFETDKTYRISDAIMMAVQERPSVKYSVDYEGVDFGTMGGMIAGGSSAVDSGVLQMGGEAARAMLMGAAKIPSGIANAVGVDAPNVGAMMGVGTGTATNPFREQAFKQVSNRNFEFNYKFYPRSATEAENMWRIIHTFKFHMHPELSSGGLFYIYPSEFNIVYYYNDKPNPTLFNISTCVLENMSVDYGGQQFASFADGTPTEVSMRLQFKELEVLTKERINLGF